MDGRRGDDGCWHGGDVAPECRCDCGSHFRRKLLSCAVIARELGFTLETARPHGGTNNTVVASRST